MTDILSKYDITFDPETHTYQQGKGRFPIPSVTQILPFKCEGPLEVIEKAAARGRRVHAWIEDREANGPWECHEPDEEDASYCAAWMRFKEITGFELARLPLEITASAMVGHPDTCTPMVERFIYHPAYHYVGRLDLIGYLRRVPGIENDLTLVDAKTVAVLSPTTALQTAAYQAAINLELKALGLPLVKHRWAAQLKPDGTCRREAYKDDRGDFSVFLARLNWTRWAQLHKYEQWDVMDPFVAPIEQEVATRLA